jgi:hypothetical protein
MKKRIKWIIIGVGFAFGLQAIVSLAYTAVAYNAAHNGVDIPQGTVSVIALGATLGAFLIGGFVVGWTEEDFRVVDAITVGVVTLALNAFVYEALPAANKAQFVVGAWLTDRNGNLALRTSTVVFIALAVIAAAAGAYWGWKTHVPSEGFATRVALLFGLLGAIVGPFILLALWGSDPNNPNQPGLPLGFVVSVLALLLLIVGVGFWLFNREAGREATYEEGMSINPQTHRHEDHRKSA